MRIMNVLDQVWNHLKVPVLKNSARTSSYPDIPKILWVSGEFLLNARDCIAFLLIVPYVVPSTRNYFLISDIRRHIARMVENHRAEGDWKVVQSLIEQTDSMSVYPGFQIVLAGMTENDFFGNMLPRMRRALRAIRWKRIWSSALEDTRPVHRAQRKRGYNDKGSRRPSHKWLPNGPFPETETVKIQVKEPRAFAWFGLFRKQGAG